MLGSYQYMPKLPTTCPNEEDPGIAPMRKLTDIFCFADNLDDRELPLFISNCWELCCRL